MLILGRARALELRAVIASPQTAPVTGPIADAPYMAPRRICSLIIRTIPLLRVTAILGLVMIADGEVTATQTAIVVQAAVAVVVPVAAVQAVEAVAEEGAIKHKNNPN